ncbi:MAG TPA: NAD(P)H-binding protein, partial [Chitinophagaceae bacterium]|nr:NAD(P)H-binding protein [Chitinophagaceae bacterium]
MNITLTGSLGNVGRRLTEVLVGKGHTVTVISHDPNKEEAIRALNALPAIGSVEDEAFLLRAFAGAEAVFTMVPPLTGSSRYAADVAAVAAGYARALERSGVRYVVNLSSIGAHEPDGNGPSGAFYEEEAVLNGVPGIRLLHLRAGMFYTNFYGNAGMIRNAQLIGNNFSGTVPLLLSHPHDIAEAAAEALDNRSFGEREVRYVVSDERTGNDVARALGAAVGLPALPWVAFPDEAVQQGAVQAGFSE